MWGFFHCSLALCLPKKFNEETKIFSAEVYGKLLPSARGDEGFGYDPIFYYPPLNKSFAEMSRQEKNSYSHRSIACQKLSQFLKERLEKNGI